MIQIWGGRRDARSAAHRGRSSGRSGCGRRTPSRPSLRTSGASRPPCSFPRRAARARPLSRTGPDPRRFPARPWPASRGGRGSSDARRTGTVERRAARGRAAAAGGRDRPRLPNEVSAGAWARPIGKGLCHRRCEEPGTGVSRIYGRPAVRWRERGGFRRSWLVCRRAGARGEALCRRKVSKLITPREEGGCLRGAPPVARGRALNGGDRRGTPPAGARRRTPGRVGRTRTGPGGGGARCSPPAGGTPRSVR